MHDLVQLVDKPTHRSGNILDLIITRENIVLSLEVNQAAAISDHYPIFFSLSNHHDNTSNRTKITYRCFKNFDRDNFASDLLESGCTRTVDQVDSTAKLRIFNTAVSETLDKHAPMTEKTVHVRVAEPWINVDIYHARTERRKAERTWRRTGLTVHRQIYKSKRNKVNDLIDVSRRSYFADKIADCNGDQRKLFSIVNGLLGSTNNLNALPIHDNKINLANRFSMFFVDKIKKINQGLNLNLLNGNRFNELHKFSGDELKCFEPATEDEIIKIIKKSSSVSCDLDCLPTNILKDEKILSILLSPITDIINESLRTGSVPEKMKCALIKPLLKKASLDSNMLKNYRPISNLSFISKVLERVVASRVKQHLENYSLYEEFQSAYRTAHSTETALLRVANDVLCSIDNSKNSVALVLLDLSAAFDT
ncbi:uncharacterized protein LOC144344404, partial [Saccoglossus kowalevskii]